MESSVEIVAGNIVYLLDNSDNRVSDNDGTPIIYQVTAVYREFRKIGLVTYYGEYVITLLEEVEDDFFGYELEIHKMSGNKLVSTVMSHKENLLREKSIQK